MLLAIDLGNTKAAFGVWSGNQWQEVRQWPSKGLGSNAELQTWLRSVVQESDDVQVFCASVNPSAESELQILFKNATSVEIRFLRSTVDFKIESLYSSELGADRLANIVGALEFLNPPFIVLDVGTATTIDAVDKGEVHIGGVILAGPQFSIDSLLAKSTLMKQAEVKIHKTMFSLNTADALSNGHFLGHYFALEGIVRGMGSELGGKVGVVTTGGLGSLFCDLSLELGEFRPNLTLDGIRIAGTSILKENS